MTLIVSFEKDDRIAILSDTRTSLRINGEKIQHSDKTVKIHPIKNIVLSTIGVSAIQGNKESIIKTDIHLSDIAEKLAENYSKIDALSFLVELSKIWIDYISKANYQGEVPFTLVVSEWSQDNAQIFEYSSNRGNIKGPAFAYVSDIGKDIIFPKYLNKTKLGQLSYEDIIKSCINGFLDVMKNYDNVGGEVVIYELNKDIHLSKWLVSPSWI